MPVTPVSSARMPALPVDLEVRGYSGDPGVSVTTRFNQIELRGVAVGASAQPGTEQHNVTLAVAGAISTGAVLETTKGQTAFEIGQTLAVMLTRGGLYVAGIAERGEVTIVSVGCQEVGKQLANMRVAARSQMSPFREATEAYIDVFGRTYDVEIRKELTRGAMLKPAIQTAATVAGREGTLAAMAKLGTLSMFAPSLVGAEIATAMGKNVLRTT